MVEKRQKRQRWWRTSLSWSDSIKDGASTDFLNTQKISNCVTRFLYQPWGRPSIYRKNSGSKLSAMSTISLVRSYFCRYLCICLCHTSTPSSCARHSSSSNMDQPCTIVHWAPGKPRLLRETLFRLMTQPFARKQIPSDPLYPYIRHCVSMSAWFCPTTLAKFWRLVGCFKSRYLIAKWKPRSTAFQRCIY